MLSVKVKIPESSLTQLKKIIERKAIEVLEKVSIQTYNRIVGPGSDFPYFSGAYISSWNISVRTPDLKFNQSMLNRDVYPVPSIKFQLDISSPYETVYISNAAPHAAMIEYSGSPTHEYPWEIATVAVNDTINRYRFF